VIGEVALLTGLAPDQVSERPLQGGLSAFGKSFLECPLLAQNGQCNRTRAWAGIGVTADKYERQKSRRISQITAASESCLPPAAVAMTVAPPTVTMMAMVVIPVVVNCRTRIDRVSCFADWRYRSGESASYWS
jgi:hypothetical protein